MAKAIFSSSWRILEPDGCAISRDRPQRRVIRLFMIEGIVGGLNPQVSTGSHARSIAGFRSPQDVVELHASMTVRSVSSDPAQLFVGLSPR